MEGEAMKAVSEASVLKACLQLLQLRGVMAWRNNSTGIYDPAKKRFRSFHGLKGTADILGIVEQVIDLGGIASHCGVFMAVECKRPGEKPTPDQAAFLAAIEDRGGAAICVSDVRELDEWLTGLGV